MRIARIVLGSLVIIGGIWLGLYLDLYVLLVGGIKEIVNGITADPKADGGMIGHGVLRLVLMGIGAPVAFIITIIGLMIAGITPKFIGRRFDRWLNKSSSRSSRPSRTTNRDV